MIADVTRMGEWSPICAACWWDEGDGPRGAPNSPERTCYRNELGRHDRKSSRRIRAASSPGSSAEPPTRARWGYSFAALDGGTEVTESWELPDEGSAFFEKVFGDQASHEIAKRSDAARKGIGATLAAIKKAAEAGAG